MSYLINNIDFEYIGEVFFTGISAFAALILLYRIVENGEKLLKKVLRVVIYGRKSERFSRREQELNVQKYISTINEPDYYGE